MSEQLPPMKGRTMPVQLEDEVMVLLEEAHEESVVTLANTVRIQNLSPLADAIEQLVRKGWVELVWSYQGIGQNRLIADGSLQNIRQMVERAVVIGTDSNWHSWSEEYLVASLTNAGVRAAMEFLATL